MHTFKLSSTTYRLLQVQKRKQAYKIHSNPRTLHLLQIINTTRISIKFFHPHTRRIFPHRSDRRRDKYLATCCGIYRCVNPRSTTTSPLSSLFFPVSASVAPDTHISSHHDSLHVFFLYIYVAVSASARLIS